MPVQPPMDEKKPQLTACFDCGYLESKCKCADVDEFRDEPDEEALAKAEEGNSALDKEKRFYDRLQAYVEFLGTFRNNAPYAMSRRPDGMVPIAILDPKIKSCARIVLWVDSVNGGVFQPGGAAIANIYQSPSFWGSYDPIKQSQGE